MVDQIKEEKGTAEEMEEAAEEIPKVIPTHTEMIAMLKQVENYCDETGADPELMISLEKIRAHVRRYQKSTSRQTTLDYYFL